MQGTDGFLHIVEVADVGLDRILVHDEKNEPRAPKPITIPVQDNKKYTNNEYRDMLYKEIAVKRKENSRRSGAAK